MSRPNLKSIFAEAIARHDGPSRAAYLDGACRGDAALRAEVEAMVRNHESALADSSHQPKAPGPT